MRAPFRERDAELDEGDIVEGVRLPTWSKQGVLSDTPRRVLVTSNGCDCEDFMRARDSGKSDAAAKLRIHVAPLREPAGSELKLQQIRDGEVLPLFWVYGDERIPDQILDLSKETSVPAALVVAGRHLATIAEWQWRRLLVHLAVERWHAKPEKIFRPELLREGETE